MPWFVFRLDTTEPPIIYMHREGYPTRSAAEEHALDNSRMLYSPRQHGARIDESVPPVIFEGTDMLDAKDRWLASLKGRHPRSGSYG